MDRPATMDGVLEALHEDPHLLEVADCGFLVNTGKQLILVDVGTGGWWGGASIRALCGCLRSAGYTPDASQHRVAHAPPFDHAGA